MARQNSGGSFDMGYSEVPNEDDIERSYEQALLRRPLAGRGRRFKIEWGAKMPQLGICCGVGLLLWVLPHPSGVTSKAWHLLSIFVATILGIALSPLPLGAVALMGLAAAMLTGTLTFQAAFSAFDSEVPYGCHPHANPSLVLVLS